MGARANPLAGAGTARRRLWRAIIEASLALLVTAVLVVAIERGARLLGPVLIVVAALSGIRAVQAWWRDLDEQWFLGEIILVTSGWALFAGAFAGLQYLSFTLLPGAFFVEVDYGKLVSPRYHAEWQRDSSRAGSRLSGIELGLTLVQGDTAERFAKDSVYQAKSGSSLKLVERCDLALVDESCPWRLLLSDSTGHRVELDVEAPEAGQSFVSRKGLEHALGTEAARLARELDALGRKLADPAAFVQPRIADFLYDTAIAFSGRDSGVFVPIGALARAFHVLESLASYLLFGIVVSRVAAAASSRLGRAGGG